MLKIRILAALISLVLTGLTLYIAPKIYFAYGHWSESLTQSQRDTINNGQILLGVLIAIVGFWLWRKKANRK